MSTQHTPGPWGCTYTSHHAHDYRLTQPNGTPLRLVVEANDHSEQRANARLIAAAPDLLQGAQLIVAAFDLCADPLNAIAKLRAAIAKATGA